MIHLGDAFSDSPAFRASISESERYLSFLDDIVRNLLRSANAVIEAQKVLAAAQDDLASWIRKLGTVFDGEHDNLNDGLDDFARSLSNLEQSRESFNLQLEDAFIRPLADYETSISEGSTRKLAKECAAARENYEKALERYLSKPASNEEAISEAASETAEANYERHRQTLRYCRHLNERSERQKFELLDYLLVLCFSYSTFYHAAHEMMSESKPGMDHLSRKLQLAKHGIAAAQNDDQVESKYLSAALSRYNPELSNFVGPSSPTSAQKSGYLFKRPAKTLRNVWSAWERRWFTCDIISSRLFYVRPDGADNEKQEIDLRTAMVRKARDPERRYCFEIVCPNRTFVLQAENKQEMGAWIDCLQKASARALFLHRPPEQRSGASAVLERLMAVPGNNRCADCGDSDPTWAGVSWGVTLCIDCSGVHRNLGRIGQVSKIRSLTLDHWTPEATEVMAALGNERVNAIFEAVLGPRSADGVDLVRPPRKAERDVLEKYITAKYVAKQYMKDLNPEETVETLTQKLWDAVAEGDLATSLQLLAWGAAINLRNIDEQGRTLLHHTVRSGTCGEHVIDFLLLQGAEVDLQDDLGFTALHYAVQMGNLRAALVLLRRGASLSVRDYLGTSVLDVAERSRDPSCITLVRALTQGLMTVDQAAEMLLGADDTGGAQATKADVRRGTSSTLTVVGGIGSDPSKAGSDSDV
ncbi:hypothetical protein DFJ74DRAFT_522734 [Hyaloraphidium curvatum]|nr:hypothetical protein DFJ74DRAFT_522734 [Hyaloraphidium curvatum]